MKNFFASTVMRTIYIALIPFLLLLMMVVSYTSNVPYWDQWALVDFWQKIYSGNATIIDFWNQHNEHRIMFPKLIMTALALSTHWNIYYEIAMNVLLGLLIYVTIARQYVARYALNRFLIIFSFIFISLLSFSLIQYENWSWGFQIQIFLNILSVVAGMACITKINKNTGYFVGALCWGVVATYSFANGVLFWIIGTLPVIYIAYSLSKRWIYISAWLIVAATSIGTYYIHYNKPEGHPSLFYSLSHPIIFIEYLTAYIGSPVAAFGGRASVALGIIGILLAIVVFFEKFIGFLKHAKKDNTLYWFLISFYALLSGVASALGRAGFGYEQAMASRYTTISNLFWIGLIGLLISYVANTDVKLVKHLSFKKTIVFVTTLILIGSVSLSSVHAYNNWTERYSASEQDKQLLLAGCYTNEILNLYPSLPFLKDKASYLEKEGLSVFDKLPVYSKETFSDSNTPTIGSIDSLSGVLGEGKGVTGECLKVNGWTIDTQNESIPKQILAVNKDQIVGYAIPNVQRPDVAEHFKSEKYATSGWTMRISSDKLPLGKSSIAFYAEYDNNRYNLIGNKEINISTAPSVSNIDFNSYTRSEKDANLFGSFDSLGYQDGQLTAIGWARDNNKAEIGHFVAIVDDQNKVWAIATTGGVRQDVANVFNDQNMLNAGWMTQFENKPAANTRLSAYVIDIEQKKAYLMQNTHEVPAQ